MGTEAWNKLAEDVSTSACINARATAGPTIALGYLWE